MLYQIESHIPSSILCVDPPIYSDQISFQQQLYPNSSTWCISFCNRWVSHNCSRCHFAVLVITRLVMKELDISPAPCIAWQTWRYWSMLSYFLVPSSHKRACTMLYPFHPTPCKFCLNCLLQSQFPSCTSIEIPTTMRLHYTIVLCAYQISRLSECRVKERKAQKHR